ncbi:MAG: hypothetical protein IKR07_02140 [Oscillospiraceae bacterium]|nr:hypothetical protein [Oscillospiraceae bacterium]
MTRIGPFFYIDDRLIFNACAVETGERRGGKVDNPYSHERLFQRRGPGGDYIDFPRGRVVWDEEHDCAIIYIDPCIWRPEIVDAIARAFELTDYVVEGDVHYHCKDCADALLSEEGL